MKIIVENLKMEFDLGCRMLKLKYGDKCPMEQLEDFWDGIEPITFTEIAKLENIEQRRVGISCMGIDNLMEEVQPTLLDSQTITKQTTWVNESGELETIDFEDTYEYYKVSGDYFNEGIDGWQKIEDTFFVKCKDTSTDRIYMIWVKPNEVFNANQALPRDWSRPRYKEPTDVNAIQCIAWTMQTTIPQGAIEKIIRQGDCIMVKPNAGYTTLEEPRHLTEKEYLELIVAES